METTTASKFSKVDLYSQETTKIWINPNDLTHQNMTHFCYLRMQYHQLLLNSHILEAIDRLKGQTNLYLGTQGMTTSLTRRTIRCKISLVGPPGRMRHIQTHKLVNPLNLADPRVALVHQMTNLAQMLMICGHGIDHPNLITLQLLGQNRQTIPVAAEMIFQTIRLQIYL